MLCVGPSDGTGFRASALVFGVVLFGNPTAIVDRFDAARRHAMRRRLAAVTREGDVERRVAVAIMIQFIPSGIPANWSVGRSS
jgi:hypothetical protein